MPITIDGDGTITGVSVGGLPDGIVDGDMLAADAVTSAKIGTKTFTSYAIICDEKSSSTDGGTFTQDAWRTRDLNTEVFDPDGIVSITSNQFTLGAGTYFIKGSASAIEVNRHQTRLYNATGSAVVEVGSSEYSSHAAGYAATKSFVTARITITANTTFELQHRCHTSRNNDGFGVGNGWGNNRYSIVEIYKEA